MAHRTPFGLHAWKMRNINISVWFTLHDYSETFFMIEKSIFSNNRMYRGADGRVVESTKVGASIWYTPQRSCSNQKPRDFGIRLSWHYGLKNVNSVSFTYDVYQHGVRVWRKEEACRLRWPSSQSFVLSFSAGFHNERETLYEINFQNLLLLKNTCLNEYIKGHIWQNRMLQTIDDDATENKVSPVWETQSCQF